MNESDFTIFWWTAFGLLTVSYALFFWFAARCGMLKDRERARYLPLWAEIPHPAESRVSSSEYRVEGKTGDQDYSDPQGDLKT